MEVGQGPNWGCSAKEKINKSRLQWQRGLRHELSSPAQIMGSWVQIPLEACMSLCVYSVFVLFCV
jgi:hypothetical protein